MRKFIFLIISSILTQYSFAQKIDKNNFSKLIIGKWTNQINRTNDGKEYLELTCKDSIQYFGDGKYIWKQCGSRETGKWKIATDKSMIILLERKDMKWKKEMGEMGEMEIPIVSLSQSQLVTMIAEEGNDNGIYQFYVKQK